MSQHIDAMRQLTIIVVAIAPDDVIDGIEEGVRIIAGGDPESARVGRAHTRRAMPA